MITRFTPGVYLHIAIDISPWGDDILHFSAKTEKRHPPSYHALGRAGGDENDPMPVLGSKRGPRASWRD